MDDVRGGDHTSQGGVTTQVDGQLGGGHGSGGGIHHARSALIAGAVEDVAHQLHIVKVKGAGVVSSGAIAGGVPARLLSVGGVEALREGDHPGGGVIVVHGLDQDAVAGVQLGAGGDVSRHIGAAGAGLQQEGGVAGVDHSALLNGDLIGALMDHETKGVGVDGGHLVLSGGIGLQHLSVGVVQGDLLALLHRSVGAEAAGEDSGVGAHRHVYTIEILVGVADGVSAIAGASGVGVGVLTSLVAEGVVILHDIVGAGEQHGGIHHVELHIGTGVGGQDGPLSGAHLRVDDRGGRVVAHQVGAAGGSHDTQHPGRSHHGGLVGAVLVVGIQGAAVRVHLGVLDDDVSAVVGKQAKVGHAGHVDLRIINDQHSFVAISGDGSAQAGEVAGLGAIAIAVDGDVGARDVVLRVHHNNGVKALVLALDDQAGGGLSIISTLGNGLGDRLIGHHLAVLHIQSGDKSVVVTGHSRRIRAAATEGTDVVLIAGNNAVNLLFSCALRTGGNHNAILEPDGQLALQLKFSCRTAGAATRTTGGSALGRRRKRACRSQADHQRGGQHHGCKLLQLHMHFLLFLAPTGQIRTGPLLILNIL